MSVIKKLFKIQQMNLSIKKDGKNPHFKSDYITLDSLVSVLQPICNDMGLLITHHTKDNYVITTIFDTEDDSKIIDSWFPLGDISNPQKVGSAVTYAKRYNLCQIFNIISDRDDDGNHASKPEFTEESLNKFLKVWGQYSSGQDAINAIESKYTMTNKDKQDISSFYK